MICSGKFCLDNTQHNQDIIYLFGPQYAIELCIYRNDYSYPLFKKNLCSLRQISMDAQTPPIILLTDRNLEIYHVQSILADFGSQNGFFVIDYGE